MRDEYDFSNAKRNPYAKKLKKQITINIDENTIDYFKCKLKIREFLTRHLLIYIYQIVSHKKENSSFHGNNARII